MTTGLIFILAAVTVLLLADVIRVRRKKRNAQRRGRTHA